MLGVRSMEYKASKNGIENRSKMNDFSSDKIIQLVADRLPQLVGEL